MLANHDALAFGVKNRVPTQDGMMGDILQKNERVKPLRLIYSERGESELFPYAG